jgi:hypothetical protein
MACGIQLVAASFGSLAAGIGLLLLLFALVRPFRVDGYR